MDYFKESLKLHEKLQWKIDFASKAELNTKDDLSLAYSPGVAEPCKEIAKKPDLAYKYTINFWLKRSFRTWKYLRISWTSCDGMKMCLV